MKRALGMVIVVMMVLGILSPSWSALPAHEEVASAPPVFNNVWTNPRYPLGNAWADNSGGDVITVFADVNNTYINGDGDPEIWIYWMFCNELTCLPMDASTMTYLGNDLFSYTLPGDALKGTPEYSASHATYSYVAFCIWADNPDLTDYATYPTGCRCDPIFPEEWKHIYPAWPPSQTNATSSISNPPTYVNDIFTVSGRANYWNSTAQPAVRNSITQEIIVPADYTKLYPCDECPVTVKVGPNTFTGKTDIWGNYSVQAAAPATAGS